MVGLLRLDGRLTVRRFDLLGHRLVDTLLVDPEALASSFCATHGLHNLLAAVVCVLASRSCPSILNNMLALRAAGVVAVLVQVLLVDPHSSNGLGTRCVRGRPCVAGAVFESYPFALSSLSAFARHNADSCHGLGTPSLRLGTSSDGPRGHELAVRQADGEGVVAAVEADEDAFASLCANVALGVVPGPFDGVLVQDHLAQAYERLSKRPAAHTHPRGEAVGPSHHGVEEQRRVLHHPRDEGMVDRDAFVNALLDAELDRAEEAADELDSDLCASIGHGVVGRGVFSADLVEFADLDLGQLHGASSQCLYRRLVVGLDDYPRVAEPLEVLEEHVYDQTVLIKAFARDNVPEHRLRGITPHDKALGDVASGPCCAHLLRGHVELLLQLDAALREEEVVDANNRNNRSKARSMLQAAPAAQHAPSAP